jgi:tetratricopeptide (TPR) repeat protein
MPTNPNHVPSRRLAEMAFRDLVLRRRRGEDCVVEDVAKGLDAADRTEVQRLLADYEALIEDLVQDAGPLDQGTRLGNFELLREIGRGGMGTVWEARQLSLSRPVALKLLHPVFGHSERILDRFRREAIAGSRLEHPAIVRVISVGEDRGIHYIAQELVEGGASLAQRIDAMVHGEPTPADWIDSTVCFFAEVAEAVAAAHATGIIHRDLKPANLLMTADGAPKVVDFGLALLESEPLLSRTGEISGTPSYMSPEQLDPGGAPVDGRTDVFSLGASLYEALTLQRPFDGATVREVADQILLEHPTDPRRLNRGISPDLSSICYRALEKEREDRYPTFMAFAADLRRYLAREPVLAVAPSRMRVALAWSRRHRALALGFAGMVLALVVVTYLLIRNDRIRAHDDEITGLVNRFIEIVRMDEGESEEHLREALTNEDPDRDFAQEAYVLGRTLVDWGKHDQASEFYKYVLHHLEGTTAWNEDLAVLLMRQTQGIVAGYRGEYERAVEILEVVRDDFEKNLGEEHVLTLNTNRSLVECLPVKDQRYRSLLEKNVRILEAKHQRSTEDEEELLASQKYLAAWLCSHGHHQDAEALIRLLPSGPERELLNGHNQAQRGQKESARTIFEGLLTREDTSDSIRFRTLLGLALCEQTSERTEEHLRNAWAMRGRSGVGMSSFFSVYWMLRREDELEGRDNWTYPGIHQRLLDNAEDNEYLQTLRR